MEWGGNICTVLKLANKEILIVPRKSASRFSNYFGFIGPPTYKIYLLVYKFHNIYNTVQSVKIFIN